MATILSKCPACGDDLKISTIKCCGCGLEIKNDFELTPFDRLNPEQYAFLIEFLKSQGNLKSVQNTLGLSYPTAKKKLSQLLTSLELNNTAEPLAELAMSEWKSNLDSHNASDIIKQKLIACGGRTSVRSIKGKLYEVWVVDESHFSCENIVPYDYDVFDVIVNLLISQGGRAKKGSGRARLGDPKCEETTVAGAIIKNYFHKNVGDSAFDPGFALIAIMEWAGIIKSEWGYVELTTQYKQEIGFYG